MGWRRRRERGSEFRLRSPLNVRSLLPLTLCGAAVLAAAQDRPRPFTVVEAGITQMQDAMAAGRVTSRQLVQQSLDRIAKYEPRLNAVMTMNPRALDEAAARDRERAAGTVRGRLHGIPIALKDNIQAAGMPTTGGALAFATLMAPYESTVATNLREAGAVIIAKTQMTELANWVTVDMPGNYNSLTGYGMNPYDPRRDPRPLLNDGRPVLSTGGSSSGVGTAVSFWAANVGTETSGSILTPANHTMLVGIKPTVGRVSRYGIIPITADQDTAGPMARSVADAAIVLGSIESGGSASRPSTAARGALSDVEGRNPPYMCTPGGDYTRYLDRAALKGARIGIPRANFYEQLNAAEADAMRQAISAVRAQGAVVVDPADIPSVVDRSPDRSFRQWPICNGSQNGRSGDRNCSIVLKYGMKRDFNAWLASLGAAAPVKTLTELRKWNLDHERAGALKYGQQNLDISDEMDVVRDRARDEADRRKDVFVGATHGIDEVLRAQTLDALLFPGSSGAELAARAGYPTVTVPFAMVPNPPTPPFPAGFSPLPMPLGVSFTGTACSEPRLIALAYAFEQATHRRRPPALFP